MGLFFFVMAVMQKTKPESKWVWVIFALCVLIVFLFFTQLGGFGSISEEEYMEKEKEIESLRNELKNKEEVILEWKAKTSELNEEIVDYRGKMENLNIEKENLKEAVEKNEKKITTLTIEM